MTDEDLLQAAAEQRTAAYAPYSGFCVGAALETEGGNVFRGCNVENASYGLSLCAERSAVFAAVAAGRREFRRMAIVADDTHGVVRPCGACLQVLWEFAPDLVLLLGRPDGRFEKRTVRDLLPEGFVFGGRGEGA